MSPEEEANLRARAARPWTAADAYGAHAGSIEGEEPAEDDDDDEPAVADRSAAEALSAHIANPQVSDRATFKDLTMGELRAALALDRERAAALPAVAALVERIQRHVDHECGGEHRYAFMEEVRVLFGDVVPAGAALPTLDEKEGVPHDD